MVRKCSLDDNASEQNNTARKKKLVLKKTLFSGERLGLMQSMAGLSAVLAQYSVRPAPGAPRHPKTYKVSSVVQIIKGGLPLIFEERVTR